MKNYLLMVNEEAMTYMKAIVPCLQFIDVKGINVKEFPSDLFLTTVYIKPAEEVVQPIVNELIADEVK